MPAKSPRAWTVWHKGTSGYIKWYTYYSSDREDARGMGAAYTSRDYIRRYCRILPAGQRPGRKKKAVKRA